MGLAWRDRCETPSNLPGLLSAFYKLQSDCKLIDGQARSSGLAFRGMANAQHDLKPSLQYKTKLEIHDDSGLAIEQRLVDNFRERAARFLGDLDRTYLRVPPADNLRLNIARNPLAWNAPTIWGAIAVARHYGVPTRLLDWTRNISVAAFFAACREPDSDGAVWWFSRWHFERAVHERWEGWDVPLTTETGQRAMEQKAFNSDATPWISNIYHPLPFPRLEKQAGFFTACGRLGMIHNIAIDHLADGTIPRGRVIVRSAIKEQLLDYLDSIGFRASTIDYPGADVEAAEITDRYKPSA